MANFFFQQQRRRRNFAVSTLSEDLAKEVERRTRLFEENPEAYWKEIQEERDSTERLMNFMVAASIFSVIGFLFVVLILFGYLFSM